ncbi:MAG: hypothetical protein V1681_00590 [Candidatus Neomarinimicrobiota bacterium]
MSSYYIQVGTVAVSVIFPDALLPLIESSVFSAIRTNQWVSESIHYRITEQDGRWLLFRNSRLTHRNQQPIRIVYALEWQIVNDFVKKNKTVLKLHAAALAQESMGYIFCGAPSAGKTSLAITLMQSGWQFLSDEFALLDSAGQIIPFPRNLIIKPHLQDKVRIPTNSPVFRVDADIHGKNNAYYLSPQLWGTVLKTGTVPLRSFIFLEKSDNVGFDLRPIARYAAFRLLMQNLFNPQILKSDRLDNLLKLVNSRPVYSLKISSPLELSLPTRQMLIDQLVRIKND